MYISLLLLLSTAKILDVVYKANKRLGKVKRR